MNKNITKELMDTLEIANKQFLRFDCTDIVCEKCPFSVGGECAPLIICKKLKNFREENNI